MPTAVSAYPSLTLTYNFLYRGVLEEVSQTYHFDGGDPASGTAWKALSDAVIAQLKTVLLTDCTIVRAAGHKGGERVADWSYDYAANAASVAGTKTITGGNPITPGDVAATMRWTTAAKTSKGKPIYLRKYFHHLQPAGVTAPSLDKVGNPSQANYETYGAAWVTGFSDGTATHHIIGPNGTHGLVAQCNQYLTTRTLKRRGKRPPT